MNPVRNHRKNLINYVGKLNLPKFKISNGVKKICIIPARGGSKRIPKKNVVNFFGKPMLYWTIQAAKKSKLFGKNIFVSSDSQEILQAAKGFGVQTILRPKKISRDDSSLEAVALHLLGKVPAKFDHLCMLLPNCPLRNAHDVYLAYRELVKNHADAVMSIINYHWLYPFWAMQEVNGQLQMFFGKKYLKNSKSLPRQIYCPSGAIRWVKVKKFLREKKFYAKNLIKYNIPFERGADIDTPEDLILAKKLFKIA